MRKVREVWLEHTGRTGAAKADRALTRRIAIIIVNAAPDSNSCLAVAGRLKARPWLVTDGNDGEHIVLSGEQGNVVPKRTHGFKIARVRLIQ